jgi:hypothetical protein
MLRTCFAAIMLFGCIGCGAGTEPTRPEKTFEEAYGEAKSETNQRAKENDPEFRSITKKELAAIADPRFERVARVVWARTPDDIRRLNTFLPLMMLRWMQAAEATRQDATDVLVNKTIKYRSLPPDRSLPLQTMIDRSDVLQDR